MIRTPHMTVMIQAVRKAGRALVRDFGEVENLQVSAKGPANFVSAADRRAEEILYTELSRARPGFGFLMEERGRVEGTDTANEWVVDPLDGTTNFLHGIPLFAISVGLVRNGVPFAGVIFNPSRTSFMPPRRVRAPISTTVACAWPAAASWRNAWWAAGCRILVAAIMAASTGNWPPCRPRWRACAAPAPLPSTRLGGFRPLRRLLGADLSPWDMAAGMILVREAGGFVSDLDGADKVLEKGDVIAGNEDMHRDLLALLRSA